MQRGVITLPVVFGVRLPAETAATIRQIAEADDRPASTVLRRIITAGLANYDTREVPAT